MLGELAILFSFKKCSFNGIAHYSLTNITHSHQRLKHEIIHFEVTFQLTWSYLPAWHDTPCELGESKNNGLSLRHAQFSAWTSQKASRVHEILSPLLQFSNIPWQLTFLWKLQNHNIESSRYNARRSALLYRGDVRERSIYDCCRFDISRSRASRLNTKVPTPEWHIKYLVLFHGSALFICGFNM